MKRNKKTPSTINNRRSVPMVRKRKINSKSDWAINIFAAILAWMLIASIIFGIYNAVKGMGGF